ncbi:MAG: AAA family ATPase, partial [bacterium]|nr:AAA family ATPase [bacterium]
MVGLLYHHFVGRQVAPFCLYDKANQFNPGILVGPNGSGKSNILEALAEIFYHIECCYLDYRPDNFEYDKEENPGGFQPEVSTPNEFELEYFFPVPRELNRYGKRENAHFQFTKKNNEPPKIAWINEGIFRPPESPELKRIEIK